MAEKIPPEEKKVNVDAEAEKKLGAEIGEAFPVSEILATARKNEKEEDKLIDKNIEARRIAEATHPNAISEALANVKPLKERKKNGNGNEARNETAKEQSPVAVPKAEISESKIIPLKLEQLTPDERKMYEKLHKNKEKQKDYLKHAAEVRADKEKRDNKKGQRKARKVREHIKPESSPAAPAQPEPVAPKAEPLVVTEAPKAEPEFLSQEEVDKLLAGVDLSTPQPESTATPATETIAPPPVAKSAERFEKRVAEVAEMLEGHNLGDENPIEEARLFMNFGRDEKAFAILEETAKKVADGTYAAGTQPPEVNPAASIELTQPRAPVSAENRQVISTAEMQGVISEQLNGKAKINALEIKNTPDGLMLHAELDGGWKGGKIVLGGAIVNSGNTIAVESLNIEARGYVKSMIENNLSGLSDAIKSHFEKQYGKPISGLQVGESGLTIEFGSEEQAKPAQENEPAVYRNNREKKNEEPSFEERKKYLNWRNNELVAKAKEFGIKVESHIRNAGEWYRKLPLKYKIGVAGALLGLNVATGGASTFVTLFTGTAMIGQRALGSASVYALIDGLYEKRLQKEEKKRGSERTKFERWKKRGYSTAAALAVFTGLPGYAIKEGFDAVGGGGLLKALGSLMGHTIPAEVTPVTVPSGVSIDQVADEAKKVLEETKEQLAKEISARDAIQAGLDEVKQQIAEEKAQVAAEASTPQETRQALRTAVEKITKLTETASAKFEMPKHADFSIHEDDTTISPYDVTPTDQTSAEDMLFAEAEGVEEQAAPAVEPEEAILKSTRSATIDLTQQGPEAVPPAPEEVATPDSVSVEPPTIESPSIPVEAPAPVTEPSVQPVESVTQSAEPSTVVDQQTKSEFTVKPVEDARLETNPDFPLRPVDSVEPSVTPAETPAPEANPAFKVNAHSIPVDIGHANSYLDALGNKVIFGGTVEERAQKALQLVLKDRSAVVYFDSTPPSSIFNWSPAHQLSKAYWFEGSGNTITNAGPGDTVDIQQPMIVNDTIDQTLRDKNIPSIDDLKEIYTPKQ
ncbi:MAG: hypothetical protein Q8P17_01820 [bacterium]|nr:hypothetical protein [bacterium]